MADDCSSAPTLKAAATFSVAYTASNFTATTMSREGCTWAVDAGVGVGVGIECIDGGWVATAKAGTSTVWKSDPMHVGSPYPPSGDYICDIFVGGDVAGGPVTVSVSK